MPGGFFTHRVLPGVDEGVRTTTLGATLTSVWKSSMERDEPLVDVGGRRVAVERTRGKGLKVVTFGFEGFVVEGIEQNPLTSSRWAKLAQEGKRIMQFRVNGRYIANVCEGKLTRYPSWTSLGLPE